MKTDLIINEDLTPYLKQIKYKNKDKSYIEFCEDAEINPYSCQWIFKFDNNFGASVIKRWGSYRFEEDLFELAIIKWQNNDTWHLCYKSEITDTVIIGHLSNERVMELLYKINNMKEENKNEN